MSEDFEKTAEQTAAFQKIWMDSMSKVMQSAFTLSPNSPPPEVLRQIRSGIFQALAQSWDEFMRSPQFLEGMKQWMDNAVNFRKMSNDFMAKVRNEMQAPSRDDIDTVMLTVRHMEKRLLDRVEDLAAQISQLTERLSKGPGEAAFHSAANKGAAARKPRRRTAANAKGRSR